MIMKHTINFLGTIRSFDKNDLYWELHIPIPDSLFNEMINYTENKRIVCTLKNHTFHCAMMPKTTFHYILLNKDLCKKLQLELGDIIDVNITNDDSKYGINISEEMEEVLFSDPDGNYLFHLLTPGKQRTLIYMVNKFKSSQIKIEKTFVIIEHLKKQKGKLDFKQLNEDFKNFKKRNTF